MAWDLEDEDCADISDWIDNDNLNGVSEVSPAGQFRMDANTADTNNYASRQKTISVATKMTAEIKLYHDALGTIANSDYFLFIVGRETGDPDIELRAAFATDGLFIHDGDSYNEVGTNLVSTGIWQKWRFLFDTTTPASATCDVYLDDVLKVKDVDCSCTAYPSADKILLYQYGVTTNDRVTHIDWIKIKTGLDAPGANILFFGSVF